MPVQAKVKDLLEVFNTGSDMALSFFVPSKLPVLRDRHCVIPVGTVMHQQPAKIIDHQALETSLTLMCFGGFPLNADIGNSCTYLPTCLPDRRKVGRYTSKDYFYPSFMAARLRMVHKTLS